MKSTVPNYECCHEHNPAQNDHVGIELHKHEDALVCSMEKVVIGELETVKEKLTDELKMLAKWVEEECGIIGHIKSFIEKSGSGYLLSTTGGNVNCNETQRSKVYISIVAIVFNLDEKKMKCRMTSLIKMV